MAFNKATLQQNDKTWVGKFVVRIIIIVAAIIALGCIAYSTAQAFKFIHDVNADADGGSIVIAVALFPIILALLWAVISLLIVCIRSKPVHPGVNIGIDLIILVILFVFAVLVTLIAAFRLACASGSSCVEFLDKRSAAPSPEPQYNSYGSSSDGYGYGSYDYGGDYGNFGGYGGYGVADYGAVADGYKKVYIVAAVGAGFMYLAALLEFILCIWACVDLVRNRRNRGNVQPQAYPMQAQGGPAGYNNGYAQGPPQPQQPGFYPKENQFYTPPPASQSPYNPPMQQYQGNLSPPPQDTGYRGVSGGGSAVGSGSYANTNSGSNPGNLSPVSNPTYTTADAPTYYTADPRQGASPGYDAAGGQTGNGSGVLWQPQPQQPQQPGYSPAPVNQSYYPPTGGHQGQ